MIPVQMGKDNNFNVLWVNLEFFQDIGQFLFFVSNERHMMLSCFLRAIGACVDYYFFELASTNQAIIGALILTPKFLVYVKPDRSRMIVPKFNGVITMLIILPLPPFAFVLTLISKRQGYK